MLPIDVTLLPVDVARSRGGRAAGLVVVASVGMQTSAILASSLFDRLGAPGVSGIRVAMAAVLALLIVRPRLRGRTLRAWGAIALFGSSIAAMNVLFYLALSRVPFGIAVTLEFLGPFAVAVIAARRPAAAIFPVLGLVGVVLVVRPAGDLDMLGVALGLAAAAALAAYTLLAERVSRQEKGLDGIALAFVFAALFTSPFSIAVAPHLQPGDLVVVALCAVFGVAVAYTADFLAVRVASARTVAVMFSFDPVLATVLGAILLGQVLDGWTLLGIALVAVAGCGSAALVGRPARRPVRRAAVSVSAAPAAATAVPSAAVAIVEA